MSVDMEALQGVIDLSLSHNFHYDTYIKSSLQDNQSNANLSLDFEHSELPPLNEAVLTADKQIQSAFDEIRFLKRQIIESESHHLFLQHVLNYQTSAATAKSSGRQEFILTESKQKLRKIKKKREQSDEQIQTVCKELSSVKDERDEILSTIQSKVRLQKSKTHEQSVNNMIQVEKGFYMKSMESFISKNIDELNLSTCNLLIDFLKENHQSLGGVVKQGAKRADHLKQLAKNEHQTVQTLKEREAELRKQRSKLNSINESLVGERVKVFEELAIKEILSHLAGIKIKDIRADGMSLLLQSHTLTNASTSKDRRRVSHVLDVVFSNETDDKLSSVANGATMTSGSGNILNHDHTNGSGMTNNTIDNEDNNDVGPRVVDVVLEPCDISLDVRGSPFEWAARDILSELRKLSRDHHLSKTS